MDFGAFIVMNCGLRVPERAPAKPLKVWPADASALTLTTAPLLTHVLDGLILPPVVVVLVVSRYCVVK